MRPRHQAAHLPKSDAVLVDVTQYCSSNTCIVETYSAVANGTKQELKKEERKLGMSISREVTMTASVPRVKKNRDPINTTFAGLATAATPATTATNWRPPNAKKYQLR